VKRALGLDARRTLPAFRRRTFSDEFRARKKSTKPQTEKVAFFVDCFTDHFELEVAWAAVRVLERLGIDVALAENGCCGRAALSQGLIDGARTRAELVAETLLPLIEQGHAIVGVEPSCMTALRSEYHHLLRPETASRLREGVFEVMEYLAHLRNQNRLSWDALIRESDAPVVSVIYHGHCQQKALGTDEAIIELLRSVPGLTLDVVDVSCCGMAGSFGYKREFYELSQHLGRGLVRQFEGRDGELIASGFSCRAQIRDLTGRPVRHPVQVLADLTGGVHD
jgi:Fe-S oxidoreductase